MTRVLLVDDHALVRAGIASILRAYGMEVVGEASDGDEAIAEARRLTPDIIFMDVRMPRCNGLQATRTIKAEVPATKVVMLTVSDDESDLFDAIRCGAEGYLLKNTRKTEFEDMLGHLQRGESIVSPALALKLLQEFTRPKDGDDKVLTKREKDVLALVARSLTNKEIALNLSISPNTVDFHMRNLLAKLHLRNRSQVAVWAAEHPAALSDERGTRT